MNKIKRRKPRLPMEAVEVLRHKGGAQSTKKGARGYDRKSEKEKTRRIGYEKNE
jgi:hypothetical protein